MPRYDHGNGGQGSSQSSTVAGCDTTSSGGAGTVATVGTYALGGNATLYATSGDNATITATSGNDIISDTGNFGSISAGDGNDDIFATGHGNVISAGTGTDVIYAGADSTITTAGNGTSSGISWLLAGQGSTLDVGEGTNYVLLAGADETVSTHGGANLVVGAASGGETISFVSGADASFLYGSGNTISDGTGTDIAILAGGHDTFIANPAGGTVDVWGFAPTDKIDLSAILPGVTSDSTADLASFVAVSTFADSTNAAGYDTSLSITGTGGVETYVLVGFNGNSLGTLVDDGVFKVATTV